MIWSNFMNWCPECGKLKSGALEKYKGKYMCRDCKKQRELEERK